MSFNEVHARKEMYSLMQEIQLQSPSTKFLAWSNIFGQKEKKGKIILALLDFAFAGGKKKWKYSEESEFFEKLSQRILGTCAQARLYWIFCACAQCLSLLVEPRVLCVLCVHCVQLQLCARALTVLKEGACLIVRVNFSAKNFHSSLNLGLFQK